MLVAAVIAGLCSRKMMHSALAICFIRFFIDPRPVAFHTVFEKIASTQRAGVREVRLIIDVRGSQCHLTLKHSQFLNKIVNLQRGFLQTQFSKDWIYLQEHVVVGFNSSCYDIHWRKRTC